MGLAIFAFILMAGTILGGYAAVTVLPGRLASRRLDERLREVSFGAGPIDTTAETTVIQSRLAGPLPALDRVLVGTWPSRLIEQSGIRTTPSGVALMSLALAAITYMMISWLVTQPLAAPLAALAAAGAPWAWLLRRRSSRLKRFEEQFPEALDLLARAIRSGQAFQTAMGMVADELPDPVGPEFKKTFDQQNFGLPLRDALNQLAERVFVLDVKFFVTAVLIQRETDGHLSEILDNLAHVVRERFKIRRQVRVHTAHGRFTAFILLSLPAVLAIALTLLNPDHMAPLFHERMGQMSLMIAMVMQAIGFVWIQKVIKIEV